jgi:hypothetical protein
MAVQVTFDIFSGRPNPTLTLDAADARLLLGRIGDAVKDGSATKRPAGTTRLGYRGLVVEQTGRMQAGLPARLRVIDDGLDAPEPSWRMADGGIGEFVLKLDSVRDNPALPPRLLALLRKEIRRKPSAPAKASRAPAKSAGTCPCAPPYEPDWWNSAADNWHVQVYNNCYNYACNLRTDTFAQPGRGAGEIYSALTCAAVRPAAVRDDLNLLLAASTTIRCPGEGILVALVIWPGADFHWYRLGRDMTWSHKPGGTPVTNLDNDGKAIPDPRTANRGPYTQFCSMMIARHGHIKIA